eukprot:1712397-Prymnesium_polylepis.1
METFWGVASIGGTRSWSPVRWRLLEVGAECGLIVSALRPPPSSAGWGGARPPGYARLHLPVFTQPPLVFVYLVADGDPSARMGLPSGVQDFYKISGSVLRVSAQDAEQESLAFSHVFKTRVCLMGPDQERCQARHGGLKSTFRPSTLAAL